MKRRIILICGRKRTGKGLAYQLVKKYLPNAGEFSFAKPIKDFCISVLGLTYEQCYGETQAREQPTQYLWSGIASDIREKYGKRPEEYLTAREVLQVFGTDLMRDRFYAKIWAEAGVRAALNSDNQICVFTDVRFPNEIAAAKFMSEERRDFDSPLILRLYRETGFKDSHPSETALDEYDFETLQRSITSKNQPMGFTPIQTGLYHRSPGKARLFDYLIDNNYDQGVLQTNLMRILDVEKLRKPSLIHRILSLV